MRSCVLGLAPDEPRRHRAEPVDVGDPLLGFVETAHRRPAVGDRAASALRDCVGHRLVLLAPASAACGQVAEASAHQGEQRPGPAPRDACMLVALDATARRAGRRALPRHRSAVGLHVAPALVFELALLEPALADRDPVRNADQFHIGEHGAGRSPRSSSITSSPAAVEFGVQAARRPARPSRLPVADRADHDRERRDRMPAR